MSNSDNLTSGGVAVRAKFKLDEVRNHAWGGQTFVFIAEYDGTIPEDRRFAEATPTGKMKMLVTNEVAAKQMTLGKKYYFDITEAPE